MLSHLTQRLNSGVYKCFRLHEALYSTKFKTDDKPNYLAKILGTSQKTIAYLCVKHPVILKLNYEDLNLLIDTVTNLGIQKADLVKEPVLFSLPPITLGHRFRVLQECGFHEITGYHVAYYLQIMKSMSIEEVKKSGYIMSTKNVPNQLANYMSPWPSSLTTLIESDINKLSLYLLRLKILKRYLQVTLNFSDIEFSRALHTYPTIKLRPLQMINETVSLLQEVIGIPENKLKSNFYLLHADSENLKEIVYDVKYIAGMDIKEILRMYPKLCVVRCSNLVKIKNIMKEFNIDNEAQIRCFNIFTLAPNTIRERLEKAKNTPEFQVYLSHPRFLKIIMHNRKAKERILHMFKTNKKCLSLNVLSGTTKDFQKLVGAPGDNSGKGKDLLYCISQELGNQYSISDIRIKMKKHPFWVNIPLVHVKLIYKKISNRFTSTEIYENCPILLYPLNKITDTLNIIKCNDSKLQQLLPYFNQIKIDKINKSQELSLILYILEKNHYFNGNGVWIDDKIQKEL